MKIGKKYKCLKPAWLLDLKHFKMVRLIGFEPTAPGVGVLNGIKIAKILKCVNHAKNPMKPA